MTTSVKCRTLLLIAAMYGGAVAGHDNHEPEPLQPGALRVIDLPGHADPAGVPLTAELDRLLIPDPEFTGEGIDLGFLKFTSQHRGLPTMLIADDQVSSIALASGKANKLVQALLVTGDVIALDRRGVGTSANHAPCLRAVEFALDTPLESARFAKAIKRWLDSCRSHRSENGVQLDQFSLPYAVRDVDRVRAALGIERIVVIGYGSGAEIAWGAAAAQPDHVVGVVELRPDRPSPVPASRVPARIKLATDAATITITIGSGDLSLAAESEAARAAIEAQSWNELGVALVEIRSRLARPNPAELAFRATLPATYADFVSDVSRRAFKGRSVARPRASVATLGIAGADVDDRGVIGRISEFVAAAGGTRGTQPTPE